MLCAVLCGFLRGIACRFWRMVTRVNLSDWLAFQARIRGSEAPQLLRDRPTDGLHGWRKFMRGFSAVLCGRNLILCEICAGRVMGRTVCISVGGRSFCFTLPLAAGQGYAWGAFFHVKGIRRYSSKARWTQRIVGGNGRGGFDRRKAKDVPRFRAPRICAARTIR